MNKENDDININSHFFNHSDKFIFNQNVEKHENTSIKDESEDLNLKSINDFS